MHMYILSRILEVNFPEVDFHLRKLGADWSMFISKCIMTLCACYIPLEYLDRIYDIFFMVNAEINQSRTDG
jgi:hypothetical protein